MQTRIDAPTPADRIAELLTRSARGGTLTRAEQAEIEAFSQSMRRRLCRPIRHRRSSKVSAAVVHGDRVADVIQEACVRYMELAMNPAAGPDKTTGAILLFKIMDAVVDQHRRESRYDYQDPDDVQLVASDQELFRRDDGDDTDRLAAGRFEAGLKALVERAGAWVLKSQAGADDPDVVRVGQVLLSQLSDVVELERDLVATVVAQLMAQWGNRRRVRNALDKAMRRPPIARIFRDYRALAG
jgi:hypothetical protein